MDCRILIAENDLRSWIRVGGSELQFFATDDEVAEFLIQGVPQEYAPYQLYTFSRVEVARKKFLDYTDAFPPDEFLSKVNARCDQRLDMFFIRSQILAPTFQVERERTTNTEGLLSLNGFISLHHGFVNGSGFFKGKQSESRISVIKGVHNVDNGLEIQNDGYLSVFRHLKRYIQKRLVFNSIAVAPDGRTHENNWQRMTEGAVAAAEQGHQWVNLPGSRVKPQRTTG